MDNNWFFNRTHHDADNWLVSEGLPWSTSRSSLAWITRQAIIIKSVCRNLDLRRLNIFSPKFYSICSSFTNLRYFRSCPRCEPTKWGRPRNFEWPPWLWSFKVWLGPDVLSHIDSPRYSCVYPQWNRMDDHHCNTRCIQSWILLSELHCVSCLIPSCAWCKEK